MGTEVSLSPACVGHVDSKTPYFDSKVAHTYNDVGWCPLVMKGFLLKEDIMYIGDGLADQ